VFGDWLSHRVSGSPWAEKAWGIVWLWEPQRVVSLVTRLIYALYFFARHNIGWQDRRGLGCLQVALFRLS
jgi:ABC-type transport system involved in cytochrome c biogenesis permease subunit